jgi:hypothetical protein
MCAYAVNYVFREPSVQVATPNQNTRTLSTKSTSAAVSTVSVKSAKPASTFDASSTVKHKNMLTIYFCKHDRIISIRGEA